MTPDKPDIPAAARQALDDALRAARDQRATGAVVVEVHVREGSPSAVKVRTERVVR